MHRMGAALLGFLAISFIATAAQAAESARDQYFNGSKYYSGLGVDKNYLEAEKWYRLAADRGYARAQTALGKLYDTGLGVRQDHAEAMKWFRRAADQGEPEAQFLLGYMHQHGRVVAKDPVEALKWFNLAANQNNDDGRRYRDELKRGLLPAQVREAEARAQAWKPKREPQT
jgi:TPR repeat protein